MSSFQSRSIDLGLGRIGSLEVRRIEKENTRSNNRNFERGVADVLIIQGDSDLVKSRLCRSIIDSIGSIIVVGHLGFDVGRRSSDDHFERVSSLRNSLLELIDGFDGKFSWDVSFCSF